MKRSSSLLKKLKSYSALAGVATVTPLVSEAQIIYTDVKPDSMVVYGGASYDLDLNGDGTLDFNFNLKKVYSSSSSSQFFTYRYIEVTPNNQNAVACNSPTSWYPSPVQFAAGDSIEADTVWLKSPQMEFMLYPEQGFLGLRLKSNGHYHYGWVRLITPHDSDYFIIKDYAFEGGNDSPIIAGKTSCDNSSVPPSLKIHGDTLIAGGTGTVQWYLNGNIIPGYSSNALSPPSKGTYTVLFTDSKGCNRLSPPVSFMKCDSLDASIKALSGTGVCEDGKAYLQILNSAPGLKYQWQKNGINVTGATNKSFIQKINTPADYRLLISLPKYGCADTSNSVHITIKTPHPVISKPHLNADTLWSSLAESYEWYSSNSSAPIVGATNRYYLPTLVNKISYKVKVEDTFGCYGFSNSILFDTCYSFIKNKSIVSSQPTTVCEGDTVYLSGPIGNYKYWWSNDDHGIYLDEEVDEALLKKVLFKATKSMHYFLYLDSAACHIHTDTINVIVDTPPSPVIIQDGDILWTIAAESYQWFTNGNPITGETDQFYSPAIDGIYEVEVMNKGGCKKRTSYHFIHCKE